MGNFGGNHFLKSAFAKGSMMLNHPSRIGKILKQLFLKLNRVNHLSTAAKSFKNKLGTMGRLIRTFVNGQYKEVGIKTVLSCMAAILYFVNPADLIPDFVPVTGLVDDFSVLVWVYSAIEAEINKFILWEGTQASL